MPMLAKSKIVGFLFTSFLFTVGLIFTLHLFGRWILSDGITRLPHDNYFNRDTDTTLILKSNILECYNECLLFNKKHDATVFNEIDKREAETAISSFRLAKSVKFTFENHLREMTVITLIGVSLMYLKTRVKRGTTA